MKLQDMERQEPRSGEQGGTALKPCPFCGGGARGNGWDARYEIRCADGNGCCICPGDANFYSKAAAYDAWNKRPVEDALRMEMKAWREKCCEALKEVERLRAELKELHGIIGQEVDPTYSHPAMGYVMIHVDKADYWRSREALEGDANA